MSFSKMDYFSFFNPGAEKVPASCAAVNPSMLPGTVVMVGTAQARPGISGQVASKLALNHFIEGAIDFYRKKVTVVNEDESPVKSLEFAFRRANNSVYDFGHSLSAGGRMGASVLGITVDEGWIAAGRVGTVGAYLFRADELYPFFDPERDLNVQDDAYLGAASVVSVQLSSVSLEPLDLILSLSNCLTEDNRKKISHLLASFKKFGIDEFKTLVNILQKNESEISSIQALVIGLDTIFLPFQAVATDM